jgi:hypothetical protein
MDFIFNLILHWKHDFDETQQKLSIVALEKQNLLFDITSP